MLMAEALAMKAAAEGEEGGKEGGGASLRRAGEELHTTTTRVRGAAPADHVLSGLLAWP